MQGLGQLESFVFNGLWAEKPCHGMYFLPLRCANAQASALGLLFLWLDPRSWFQHGFVVGFALTDC